MVAVLEITTYRVEASRVADYLEQRPAMDAALEAMPGLRSLATAQLAPGRFVDVAVWDDRDAAERAQRRALDDARLAPLFAWLEDVSMEFGEVLRT